MRVLKLVFRSTAPQTSLCKENQSQAPYINDFYAAFFITSGFP